MEETIKEIKEKLIQPFYEFPNPTSIELKCNDIDLILDLIKEYQKIKMQLEVEKIDNKYNQEETHEETIPRYKIREIKEEYEKERSNMTQIIFSKYGKTQQTFKQAVYTEVIKVLDEILGE